MVVRETFFLPRPTTSRRRRRRRRGTTTTTKTTTTRKMYVRIDRPDFGGAGDKTKKSEEEEEEEEEEVNLILIFSHGLHEHSSRFRESFDVWASSSTHKIATMSFDHVGHGRSDPISRNKNKNKNNNNNNNKRGTTTTTGSGGDDDDDEDDEDVKHQIDSFETMVEDMRAVVDFARQRFGNHVPIAISGVSLGGLVAMHTAMTYPKEYFVAIVLIAPAINVKWTFQKKALAFVGEVVARAAPHAKIVPATTTESLTDDAATAREFEEDPYNYIGKARARFGNEILKAMKELDKAGKEGRVRGISRNVFAVHAEKDAVTCADSTERFFAQSLKDVPNKQFVKLAHTKGHLLLHEPGCEWTRELIGRFLTDAALDAKKNATTTTTTTTHSTTTTHRSSGDDDDALKSRL